MSGQSLAFDEIKMATCLGGYFEQLEGKSIVLMAGTQLKTAAALIELDGWARRLILCPPDLEPGQLGAVIRDSDADALVYDGDGPAPAATGLATLAPCFLPLRPRPDAPEYRLATEWAMLTSGTTGDPKIVVHTLETLTGAIDQEQADSRVQNWATMYDTRRYGGLQIFLRAVTPYC